MIAHDARRKWLELSIIVGASTVAALAMSALLPGTLIVDETFHEGQIHGFIAGDFYLVPHLPMLPGYHALVASVAWLLDAEPGPGLRLISAGLALSAVVLAWGYLRSTDAPDPLRRSLQFLLCPLWWPFWFLIYTDMVTLAVIMLALVLVQRGWHLAAALAGLAALAVRQTSIFWIGLFWIMAMVRNGTLGQAAELVRDRPHQWLRQTTTVLFAGTLKTWKLLLPAVAFVVFVIVNQGIAVGDRDFHHVAGVYPTQLFFLLLVIWLILLPIHIRNLGAIFRLLRQRRWIGLLIAGLFVVYMLGFSVTHFHNFGNPEFHLRNRLLMILDEDWLWRALSFVGVAWAGLSLAVTRLQQPAAYWLYPVTAVALLPIELIEQRYYIVPVALLLVFRTPAGQRTEWALLAWFALLSALLTWAIASERYFL